MGEIKIVEAKVEKREGEAKKEGEAIEGEGRRSKGVKSR